MVDKNGNGIPDDQEKNGVKGVKFVKGNPTPDSVMPLLGFTGWREHAVGTPTNRNVRYAPSKETNWGLDRSRDMANFFGGLLPWGWDMPSVKGGGYGDYLYGSNPSDDFSKDAVTKRRAKMSRPPQQGGGITGTQPISFADALSQAMGMLGDQGASDIPFVNYDPERNAARSNASDADYRLGAMYKQLQNSIAADSPQIQAAYQTAIDNSANTSQTAQQNAQAAVDASQARNQSVLSNLGIQDANAQIIDQGRDANTQAAQRIGDMAANQQATSNNLTQNQAASVQQNNSIAGAAGLEGNLQRAQNQMKLQQLLAQIDAAEMDKNSSISAQNASARQSAQQNGLSTGLSLAQQLYGYNRDDINAENDLQMQAMKMMQPNKMQSALQLLPTLLNEKGGMFGSDTALDQDQLIKLLSVLAKG